MLLTGLGSRSQSQSWSLKPENFGDARAGARAKVIIFSGAGAEAGAKLIIFSGAGARAGAKLIMFSKVEAQNICCLWLLTI